MARKTVLASVVSLFSLLGLVACTGTSTVRISTDLMRDKIKGGWVGQTIGVCYGGPTEFRWAGSWIGEDVPLDYSAEQLVRYFNNDDLYMDISFLAVLAEQGLDATSEQLGLKFANAGFSLWHANQAGRWNILHGVMPPASGFWKNNPHADDIDFQIEADFIGLISPAMPATALDYCERVGHIMNYGDGVYGGVWVAAMYSQAYVEKDIAVVVQKALASLPPKSQYYQCISDVLAWWRQYPDDWRRTWFEVQKKWSSDVGCPECAIQPGNIDAKLNGAYIAIGLLYGGGDFGKTLEIATRCGQDSDCNPSNAAGVLGALLGFSHIPDQWKVGLDQIENEKFNYCDYSLNEVCEVTYRLAGELVARGGGSVGDTSWIIQRQKPSAPDELEVGFEGLVPAGLLDLKKDETQDLWTLDFEGRAYAVHGNMQYDGGDADCQVFIDGSQVEEVTLSGNHHDRRTPLFWNYDLEPGTHRLEIRKTAGDGVIRFGKVLVYK